VQKAIGMNITIVTSAKTDPEAKELLARLGMPFTR
jgi:ribosomal protein L5